MIMVSETNNYKHISEIVDIHMSEFKGFFLTELGKGFVKTLYNAYLSDEASGILLAFENERVVGFIAYSKDYSAFFKRLIKKKLLKFAWHAILATIRHPSFIKRLLGAFRKSDEVSKNEKYVELASIAVKSDSSGKGVGTELIQHLKEMVDFEEFEYISLETDAIDNDAVNQFYMRNGFELTRTYKTAQGREMNEYHYRG